ncbi:MAG: helix-turn-helix domain-containing protein [Mesorhizobium sp.]|uniref:helix-turn-helix domain-containing protein n=1 Tax=Mesorhizobium sp. SP-1A TaxID=3077840 RepID=UPI001AC41C8C|nr:MULTISPECIES: helix-turn-helix domain-containing protein [unclassified Mesorhizobium]MBN9244243.1 helix-turn-helix domain-containing protein [Mesorhizobium sp.]
MTFSLNVRQAVEASGLTRSHLYEAMKLGDLPARKAGRRTIIMAEDLRRYIEKLPSAKEA